jgi:Uncharacterized conserved protein
VKHLIFVYGTLKRQGGAWGFYLGSQRFVGEATTVNKFHMLDGGFPVALWTKETAPIRGEVYEVDDEALVRLDGYEGEGHMFKRQHQSIQCDNGEKVTAQMYFGVPEYWSELSQRPTAPLNDHGQFLWER